MPADADPESNPSLGKRTKSLVQALRVYYSARVELLSLEMQEAAISITRRVGFVVAAIILLLFGWGFAMAAVTELIADLSGMAWKYAALITAGGHVLVAILFLLSARKGPPLFEATRAEIEKDKAWLSRQDKSGNEKPS